MKSGHKSRGEKPNVLGCGRVVVKSEYRMLELVRAWEKPIKRFQGACTDTHFAVFAVWNIFLFVKKILKLLENWTFGSACDVGLQSQVTLGGSLWSKAKYFQLSSLRLPKRKMQHTYIQNRQLGTPGSARRSSGDIPSNSQCFFFTLCGP